jgi:hypothetical protein
MHARVRITKAAQFNGVSWLWTRLRFTNIFCVVHRGGVGRRHAAQHAREPEDGGNILERKSDSSGHDLTVRR